MYEQKYLDKLNLEPTPAIILAPKFGMTVSTAEYDRVFAEFKAWAMEKKALLVEKWSEKSAEDFLDIFATTEFIPFFKSGCKLDYDYLNGLFEKYPMDECFHFMDQKVCAKLYSIRQSITVLGLNYETIQALKTADTKGGELTKHLLEVNRHTLNSLKLLPLMSYEPTYAVPYLKKMLDEIKENATEKTLPKKYLSKMTKLGNEINKACQDYHISNGFLSIPVN